MKVKNCCFEIGSGVRLQLLFGLDVWQTHFGRNFSLLKSAITLGLSQHMNILCIQLFEKHFKIMFSLKSCQRTLKKKSKFAMRVHIFFDNETELCEKYTLITISVLIFFFNQLTLWWFVNINEFQISSLETKRGSYVN